MSRQDTKSTSSGGVGVLGLLGVVFVTLKLLGKITWSWWWVTAPFWGGLAIVLACFALFGVANVGATFLDWRAARKRRSERERRERAA